MDIGNDMSKQPWKRMLLIWVDAYDEKYSELIAGRDEGDNTLTDEQIEKQSTNWAERALERAVDGADFMRKAERERNDER